MVSATTPDLNTKLQGQHKLIYGWLGAVSFGNEAETGSKTIFPCDLLDTDG
jgi:hypothetical protein